MEDPPIESTSEEAAAPVEEAEPIAPLLEDEEPIDTFHSNSSELNDNPFEGMTEDPTAGDSPEAPDPYEAEIPGTEDLVVIGDEDPFGAPTDASAPSPFEDAFTESGELEDPFGEAQHLRAEAWRAEDLATASEARATELEEKGDRSEAREDRLEERAEELRARAEAVEREGRRERARELRDKARRADERAEDAEELKEKREERSEALRERAADYRAEAEELHSDADRELDEVLENIDPMEPAGGVGASIPGTFDPFQGNWGVIGPDPMSGDDLIGAASDQIPIADIAQARPLEGPVSLADIAGRLSEDDLAEVIGNISSADLGDAGDSIQSAVADALAAGGSPVDIGRSITQTLEEEFGEDAQEIGDTVTGALGGILDTGDAGKMGDTVLSAIDNVLKGDSPVDAVRAALDDAGLSEYGEVAERAITVAERIADGDFEGAAEAAGLDDELDPILGGYRAAAGLAEGDVEEFGRGVSQAAGYGDHLEAAERLAQGDLEGAAAAAAKAAGYDQFGAAADNLARGDVVGAAEEAARAGGYGDYYDTADKIAQGDLEGAAVGGAGIVGEAAGLTGLGGSVEDVFEGNYVEGLGSAALGAAGVVLGGPIVGAAGELLGSTLGGALGDLGADKAFDYAAVAAVDVAEGAVNLAGDVIDGAGQVVTDVAEGAGEVIEDVAEGAGEAIVDVAEGAGEVVGSVIDSLNPFDW
jgi:hypothetical protein